MIVEFKHDELAGWNSIGLVCCYIYDLKIRGVKKLAFAKKYAIR